MSVCTYDAMLLTANVRARGSVTSHIVGTVLTTCIRGRYAALAAIDAVPVSIIDNEIHDSFLFLMPAGS